MGKDQDFVRHMCRHLVALGFRYQSQNDKGEEIERFGAAPGFIMSFHGDWFWITAGHWFNNDFKQLLSNPKHTFFWIDSFGPEVTNNHPIPYGYDPEDAVFFDVRENGIDFGMIAVNSLDRSNFDKNGIIPIPETNWLYQPGLEFNGFQILGFPKGSIHDDGRVTPTLVSVIHINPEEARREVKTSEEESISDGWFVGRIPDSLKAIEVKGMSGGPIYGYRTDQNGDLRYHVVAVQSRWFPRERIILGCPVPAFACRIYDILRPFSETETNT